MGVIRITKVGDWIVSPDQNRIERAGQSVRLKPRAMDVLVHLASCAGDVVSTDELIEHVWQGRVVGDGTIYQSINQLRRALGEKTDGARYIETIAKRGYRLVAPVVTDGGQFDEGQDAPIRSLVVLPLKNLSSDQEQEYFADGMTEVLIANLAKVSALKIISRTSAMRYKDSKLSLPEIAEELNVDGVVEGSVLRSGNKVRITLQLIRAATDLHLWGENYEGDVQDVLLLQSEVAQAVTREIRIALTPEEMSSLAMAHKVDPFAYEAYLKGRFHYWKVSPEGFDLALENYNRALEIDPSYALAYTGVGDVWGARGCFGMLAPREAFAIGKPAALKAVEMEDQLAEAHEMIARYKLLYEWQPDVAEKEAKMAVKLGPNNPDVRFAYWWTLLAARRFREARAEADHILDLDPHNPTFHCLLGYQLLWERCYEDALSQFEHALALAEIPWAHWGLCSTSHRVGEYDRMATEGRMYLSMMGHPYAAEAMDVRLSDADYQGAVLDAAEALAERARSTYVQALLIARLFVFAEQEESAFHWLQKGVEYGEPWMGWLHLDVDWDSVRDNPKFIGVLERIGMER